MERTSCKTDFQSWKGIMALKLLCCNIIAYTVLIEEILYATTLLWSIFASYHYIAPTDR